MKSLGLKSGEWVEVLGRDEILATLDEQGSLDGLPFMPEMLRFCGQRLRVYKRAHKTCDTVNKTGGRRMSATVHLEQLRCDGAAHGGCQAGCLIFWKEAWLKRCAAGGSDGTAPASTAEAEPENIRRGVCFSGRDGPEQDRRYRCQATEIPRATTLLKWWDARQYVEDLVSRNIGFDALVRGLVFALFRRLVELGFGYRFLVRMYDAWARLVNAGPFPLRHGSLARTPTGELGLRPGEWVRVKSLDEIMQTLDVNNRNRGLYFDVEATRFCGGTFRVLQRVTRIIDEKTGAMLHFENPCIVLEQGYCRGEMSKHRLFCPRAIYAYWREIWLERVPPPEPM